MAYAIKCIFIIQPVALLDSNPSLFTRQTMQAHLRSVPSDTVVYRTGYDYILRKAGDKIRDASHLFEGNDNVYLDIVHFNKNGSKLIGEYIRSALP